MADGPDSDGEIKPHYDATKVTGVEMWAQKRRLADAMRLVIERLVPSEAPVEELRAAAEGLERYADMLKAHPRLKRAVGHAESANAGDVGAFFDQSPLIGLANPLAPPIVIGRAGERSAAARVNFGSAYEGPPGSVHGGYVAAAFDEVLGYVQSLAHNPGFTGTLTVRYRKPTPLHEELRFEARIDRVEGRKIFTSGSLHASVGLCAEAEAIFIGIDESRLAPLFARRAEFEARQAAQRDDAGSGRDDGAS